MEILDVIRQRRSIRSFQSKPIPKEIIETLVDAAQWAPSSCNKQSWKFIAVTDQQTKNSLVENARSIGFVRAAPLTMVITCHKSINKGNNAHIQSAAAAIQNMLLYAHTIGIGSCWACGFGKHDMIKRILNIPDHYMIVAFVSFGYPKKVYKRVPERKQVDEILSFNKFKFDNNKLYPNSYLLKDWTFEQARRFYSDALSASSPSAGAYMRRFIGLEVAEQVKNVLPYLEEKSKVLEVFPYTGNFCLSILKQKKLDYSILEFDEKIVSFIQERKDVVGVDQEIKTVLTKEPKIPLEDNSFDTIIFLEGIGSLPEHEKLIAEIHRVLKPGGKLLLSFKNKKSFTHVYHKIYGKGEVAPFELLTLNHVKGLLRKGFEVQSMKGFSINPLQLGRENKALVKLSRIIFLECKKKKS